jgi:hypothetical protein
MSEMPSDASGRTSASTAATVLFLTEQLWPSWQRLVRAAEDAETSADVYAEVFPAVILHVRNLRLFELGVSRRVFEGPGYLLPVGDGDEVGYEWNHMALAINDRLVELVELWRDGFRWNRPMHADARSDFPGLVETLGTVFDRAGADGIARLLFTSAGDTLAPEPDDREPMAPAGDPRRDAVRAAIAVSAWLGNEPALLEFVARATLHDPDMWEDELNAAAEAFIERYDPCSCDNREPWPGPEPQWPGPEGYAWLFEGAPLLLSAIADTEAMLAPTDPLHGTDVGAEALEESIHLSLATGETCPTVGAGSVAPINDPEFQHRLVHALRVVWRAVAWVTPPHLRHVMFAEEVRRWDQPFARELLARSGGPGVLRQRRDGGTGGGVYLNR